MFDQIWHIPSAVSLLIVYRIAGNFRQFRHVVQVVKFYLVCCKLSLRMQAPFTFTTKNPPGPPEALTTMLLASALQRLVSSSLHMLTKISTMG